MVACFLRITINELRFKFLSKSFLQNTHADPDWLHANRQSRYMVHSNTCQCTSRPYNIVERFLLAQLCPYINIC